MNALKQVLSGLCAAVFLVGAVVPAEAVYIDEKRTFSFGAKLQTRVSFRLQDAEKNQVGMTAQGLEVGETHSAANTQYGAEKHPLQPRLEPDQKWWADVSQNTKNNNP